jgi:hypothetical protein
MYTAQEIYEMSIVIMDELSDSGTVDPNQTKEYHHKAPRLLEMWQRELGAIENIEVNKISSLTQELDISDANCPSGAYYLAMHFAMADQNSELVSLCRSQYEELKRKARLPLTATTITDVYGGEEDE